MTVVGTNVSLLLRAAAGVVLSRARSVYPRTLLDLVLTVAVAIIDPYHSLSIEAMAEEKERPRQSLVQSMEERWQRTRDHFNSYPYVWASYTFVFGGLGLYTAYRWRALRKAEDELLRFQDRLKQTMSPKELAEAMEEVKGRG